MKTVLIIDHGERCPEDALTLLRASGYAVELSTPDEALRSGPEPETSRRVPGGQERISEELRQASLVMENSPVVLFRWRAEEGWPVDLASTNVSRFGYAKEELLSGAVPFSALVHPDDLERVAQEVGGYSAAGCDSFQQEYRIVTRGGKSAGFTTARRSNVILTERSPTIMGSSLTSLSEGRLKRLCGRARIGCGAYSWWRPSASEWCATGSC